MYEVFYIFKLECSWVSRGWYKHSNMFYSENKISIQMAVTGQVSVWICFSRWKCNPHCKEVWVLYKFYDRKVDRFIHTSKIKWACGQNCTRGLGIPYLSFKWYMKLFLKILFHFCFYIFLIFSLEFCIISHIYIQEWLCDN